MQLRKNVWTDFPRDTRCSSNIIPDFLNFAVTVWVRLAVWVRLLVAPNSWGVLRLWVQFMRFGFSFGFVSLETPSRWPFEETLTILGSFGFNFAVVPSH